jgi:hypothetical protein
VAPSSPHPRSTLALRKYTIRRTATALTNCVSLEKADLAWWRRNVLNLSDTVPAPRARVYRKRPRTAPRNGGGGAGGGVAEGGSGDAERSGRRAAPTLSLAPTSARAAISRSTSATRTHLVSQWSPDSDIAPRRAAPRLLRADSFARPSRPACVPAPARRDPAPRRACARLTDLAARS